MSVRFRWCLLAWIVVVGASKLAQADVYEFDSGFTMEITPAEKVPRADQAPLEPIAAAETLTIPGGDDDAVPCVNCGHQVSNGAAQYQQIYDAIPFSRAEYNANPSYRHDSTMEILTGNARHQTILRHNTIPIRRPQRPINAIPYRYNNPASGLNYYFYFPYWNSRGIY